MLFVSFLMIGMRFVNVIIINDMYGKENIQNIVY